MAKTEVRRMPGCSGQALLEACLWTLLLTTMVIAGVRGFGAELRRYKAVLIDYAEG